MQRKWRSCIVLMNRRSSSLFQLARHGVAKCFLPVIGARQLRVGLRAPLTYIASRQHVTRSTCHPKRLAPDRDRVYPLAIYPRRIYLRIGAISLGGGSCPAGVPVTNPMRCLVTRDSIHFFKIVKYSAITLAALMVAGIVTLMFLARGTGEDITGIVAPALLITLVSGAAAIVASVLLKREQKASDMRPSNDLPV